MKSAIKISFLFISVSMIAGCATQPKAPTTQPQQNFTGPEITIPLPNLPPDAKPLVLVRIPAGSFQMGSPADEPGREANEGPQHPVIISEDFYLGKFEVTQAQWQALMLENPSTEVADNYPVNKVSWHDAQDYLDRLEKMINQGEFRLPTEAEWEYAARAGTQTATFIGNNPGTDELLNYAWFRYNSEGLLNPVGQKKPNPWGLHDMYGNVWEWTSDWYGPYFNQAQTDPTGPDLGMEKVIRGGSWMGRTEWMRSADRGKFTPDNRRNTGGFRIVFVPEE